MADENINIGEENQNNEPQENSQTNPATGETNTKSIVHDGVATFIIDEVSTDVKLQSGQIGCFYDTDYTIATTGVLKSKDNRAGVIAWSCKIGGVDYTFDNYGHCTLDPINALNPDAEPHHLWIVASSIDVKEGSNVRGTTRGGMVGTKIVTVDSLTVRDQFAMVALEALIHRMNDPIECSTASVRYITDKAYEYANSMMISSAYARAVAGEEEPSHDSPGTVDVDPDTLSNNTEKLLNNIHKAIEAEKSELHDVATALAGTIKIDNPTGDTFDVTNHEE